jgi:hypothetical protein
MIITAAKACGFRKLTDVRAARLREYLAECRKPRPKLDRRRKPVTDSAGQPVMLRGLSARRHNAIVTA